MNTITRTAAALTAGALLAVPTAVLVSAPAYADVERQGTCGTGRYELSVDRENGGFEVNADLIAYAMLTFAYSTETVDEIPGKRVPGKPTAPVLPAGPEGTFAEGGGGLDHSHDA